MTDVGGGAGAGGRGGAEDLLDRARNALKDFVEVKVVTLVANVPIKLTTTGGSTETSLGESDTPDNALQHWQFLVQTLVQITTKAAGFLGR